MADGNELAHQFGKQHPGYTFELDRAKWNHKNRDRAEKKVGWPSCKAIADAGSKTLQVMPALR